MAQRYHLTAGEDEVVKSEPGRVYRIIITAVGATIGDQWTIRDGGIGGTVKLRGTIQAANGTWEFPLVSRQGDPGLLCATSIAFTHTGADNTIFATLEIS